MVAAFPFGSCRVFNVPTNSFVQSLLFISPSLSFVERASLFLLPFPLISFQSNLLHISICIWVTVGCLTPPQPHPERPLKECDVTGNNDRNLSLSPAAIVKFLSFCSMLDSDLYAFVSRVIMYSLSLSFSPLYSSLILTFMFSWVM